MATRREMKTCVRCDETKPTSESIDHIVPISRGGAHEQSNLQWAHLICNIRKGARVAPSQGEEVA